MTTTQPDQDTAVEPGQEAEAQTEFNRLLEMPAAWKEINKVIVGCDPKRLGGHKQIEIAYAMAYGIEKLRALLKPDVMKPIMALMNTEIGFLTDRGPHVRVHDNKDDWKKTPYCDAAVRDVLVTAFLNGVWPVSNQFNIIAGRMYITQTGYLYKMNQIAGIKDIKVDIDPPMNNGNYLVSVQAVCTWTLNGVPDESTQKFQLKASATTSADALRGKVHRKILKVAYQQITGGQIMGVMPDDDHMSGLMPAAPPGPSKTSLDPTPSYSGRLELLNAVLKEYGELWSLDAQATSECLRAYVRKTFNFKTMGLCQEDDFREMLRRIRLGPLDKETLPSPEALLNSEPIKTDAEGRQPTQASAP